MDGQTTPEFDVCNGLRQGCVTSPTLFNLYFALVMEQWRGKCGEFGVDVQYKYGRKLVGERKRRPLTGKITELLFVDDAVATGTGRDGMERAAKELERLDKVLGAGTELGKDQVGCGRR